MTPPNVLPEFLESEFADWAQAQERPTMSGVFQIRPEGSEEIFWSYWDAEFEGGKWGRATRDHTMVQTPVEGGYSPKQDREFRGLLHEPKIIVREPVAGRVKVLEDIDAVLVAGVLIGDLELVGDEWHGICTTDVARYKVKAPVDKCSQPFMGNPPVEAPQTTEEVEEDDGEL